MRRLLTPALLVLSLAVVAVASGSTPGQDARLSKDCTTPLAATPTEECGGYVSNYTLVTDTPYTDATLQECSVAHGRQNEPAVAVDPRDTRVLVGSSNDYCGVYNTSDAAGNPVAAGPIWLGYYRSQASGVAGSWQSSLVPGYPDDKSPYAALSAARTASAGDPVIAWDNHGRAFFGSETSDDPAGSAKTFGDVFVARFVNPDGTDAPTTAKDGLKYDGTTVVAKGSSAPNLLGKFNDKTAIEVDRTGGACDGNVYFSWSRFTGNSGVNAIYFSRSTNHGVTFSQPMKLSNGSQLKDLQGPDISVTGNGHVYVTFRSFSSRGQSVDAIYIAKSTDCGQTFGPAQQVTTFTRSDAKDVSDPAAMTIPQSQKDDPSFEGGADAGSARDCGDFADHCLSGYTFFRRDTLVRSTADQTDAAHEWIYMVYDATKPDTVTDADSSYSSAGDGKVGQARIFYLRYDGANGSKTGPSMVDDTQPLGHQVFPDISADHGLLHALWWDSRNDTCYSVQRPIGNCGPDDATTHQTVPSLDVYATSGTTAGGLSPAGQRVTDVTSNPNFEQFDNRQVPFAGDYLWVTSVGSFSYGAWTDWRNTVAGTDQREAPGDADAGNADVHQCRVLLHSTDKKGNDVTSWSSDRCPHDGGLDQDIYGDATP